MQAVSLSLPVLWLAKPVELDFEFCMDCFGIVAGIRLLESALVGGFY